MFLYYLEDFYRNLEDFGQNITDFRQSFKDLSKSDLGQNLEHFSLNQKYLKQFGRNLEHHI